MELRNYRLFLYSKCFLGLDILPRNCGMQIVSGGERYGWNGLKRGDEQFYILQYTISGCGEIRVGKDIHSLPQGSAFFIKVPSDHHYYRPHSSNMWQFYFFTFKGKDACRLGDEFTSKYGNVFQIAENASCLGMLKEIVNGRDNLTMDNPYMASAKAYSFLMQFFSDVETPAKRTRQQLLLDNVTAYIMENLASPLLIGNLAKRFNYSREYFSRTIHQASGMTIQQYINDLRLNMAAQILKNEQCSIKETAAMVGFNEASYFCRAFRKKHGLSPKQFALMATKQHND